MVKNIYNVEVITTKGTTKVKTSAGIFLKVDNKTYFINPKTDEVSTTYENTNTNRFRTKKR